MQEQIMAAAPPGVRAEFRELDRLERGGFAELRAAGDPPDVPVVFLVAGKPQPLPPAGLSVVRSLGDHILAEDY
jgi:hypothetical protein